MKRLIMLMLTALLALSSCGTDNNVTESKEPGVFEGMSVTERVDLNWFFIPDEATIVRTEESNEVAKISFTGCEYPELNAYVKKLYDAFVAQGYTVYDATNPLAPKRLYVFDEAALNIRFAGTAYSYYCKAKDCTLSLIIQYYGSAGGKYGNGQSIISLSDVSNKIDSLLKE